MNALFLTLFVSLILAFLGVLLFAFTYDQGSHHQADRLSLLPLDDPFDPVDPVAPVDPKDDLPS